MQVATQVTALLAGLTPKQIADLPPAKRQQLADECDRVRRLVIEAAKPKSGVLARLNEGERPS